MGALGVFGLLQIVAFAQLARSHMSSKQFQDLLFYTVITTGIIATFGFIGLTYKGWIAPWTDSLWDSGYAKKYIPIIASVSEHQPTAWPSFFMDLQLLIFLFPAGVIICFRDLRDEHVFVIIHAVVASYFAGVRVRLMLALTRASSVSPPPLLFHNLLDTYIDSTEPDVEDATTAQGGKTPSPAPKHA